MINRIKDNWRNTTTNTKLWTSALGSSLIYLAFTLPFPLMRYYAVNPPVDYAKLTHHSYLGFVAYLFGIIFLFGFYYLGLQQLTKDNNTKRNIRFILLSGGVFAIILIFSYPQTAIDLFINAIRTRAWARYGMSPFITSPNSLPPADPWIGLAGEWVDIASPYGPIWEWLSLGAYYVAGGSFLGHLFAIKVVSALAYLGSACLLYWTLRLICPQWAVLGTAFFAWNPLVLFESVQNAHNDILMVFFMLAAIYAFVRVMQGKSSKDSTLYAIIFILSFAASILVKFVSLMVLPFFVLALALRKSTWPQRILSLVFYGIAILGLSVLIMWSYWPGVEDWAVLEVGSGAGRSVMALLILLLRPIMGTNLAFDIIKGIIYIGLVFLFLWCLWRVWCQGREGSLGAQIKAPIWAGYTFFFGYVLFGASTFHAWYFLWCLPLAAMLIPVARPTSVAWTFSLVALLVIPYFETIRVWIPYLNQNHLLGHAIGVPLLVFPVLLALWKPIKVLPEEAYN
jgi:hypothetical protein